MWFKGKLPGDGDRNGPVSAIPVFRPLTRILAGSYPGSVMRFFQTVYITAVLAYAGSCICFGQSNKGCRPVQVIESIAITGTVSGTGFLLNTFCPVPSR